jgi:hypothetical protein
VIGGRPAHGGGRGHRGDQQAADLDQRGAMTRHASGALGDGRTSRADFRVVRESTVIGHAERFDAVECRAGIGHLAFGLFEIAFEFATVRVDRAGVGDPLLCVATQLLERGDVLEVDTDRAQLPEQPGLRVVGRRRRRSVIDAHIA